MTMEDQDQKAIESMADAMLGTFEKKEEKKEEPKAKGYVGTRYWEESELMKRAKARPLDDDLDSLDLSGGLGGGRTTSTPPDTLHTTSKEGHSPYKPRYGSAFAGSQGGGALPTSPLRHSLKKLTPADVDGLDMTRILTKVKDVLLDEFEKQNWLILGNAEAHMFRAACDSNLKAALRAVAMKIATNDIMRDKTKSKPAK
jgi:hypothetical protein